MKNYSGVRYLLEPLFFTKSNKRYLYILFISICLILLPLLIGCLNNIPKPESGNKINNSILLPDSYSNHNSYSDNSYFKDNSYSKSNNYSDPNFKTKTKRNEFDIQKSNYQSKWWEHFKNSELNNLIENALSNNLSLKESWERLKQAKALEKGQKKLLFPYITFDSSISRKESGESSSLGNMPSSYNSFSAGAYASYEVDLWGNIDARILEYKSKTAASRFDFETSAISIAAEITNNFIDLITVKEKLAIAEEQVKINTMLLELLELRFQNSMSTALDILQQREIVARSYAKIPPLELKKRNLLNSIALLCGRPSSKDIEIEIKTETLFEIALIPDTGIPSDLLLNRPDIKSALFKLNSSQWSLFQTRAEGLPSLTLTGSFLFQHTSLENILENWILSLASKISGTLFDAGKNKADVEFALSVVNERLANYKKTIFTAIMEVENSIAAEKYRMELIELLNRELNASKLALQEAKNRYIKGMESFILVITEQLNVQNLEIEVKDQKALLLKERVALYKAVGSRWTEKL